MRHLANISLSAAPASGHLWAALLAGGDGIRMRDLTVRIVGDDRPKQFCPIVGAESLLRQTRARLAPLFAGDRQVFVVSCAHEKYYSKELADAKDSVVIEQPINRGTAVGIIAALVRIMQADPDAIVGFFPCDHYYSDDESFRSVVSSATAGAEQFPQSLVIVGAEAEYAETEYGWIEPGSSCIGSTSQAAVSRQSILGKASVVSGASSIPKRLPLEYFRHHRHCGYFPRVGLFRGPRCGSFDNARVGR